MTSDVTEVRYWIDLAIKMAIGIVVSIIGLDYKNFKSSLQDLQEHKYRSSVEVQVIQAELGNIKNRLDKIDGKLDRALER
mgnify:CR=1 FL=1